MTNFRINTLVAALGIVAASSANAFPLVAGSNLLEDDDFEVQVVDIDGNGFLGVGDTLEGIIDITKIGTTLLTSPELGGIFRTEVKTAVLQSNGLDSTAGTADDIYNYTFGPVGSATGTIVSFYQDVANDFPIGGAGCNSIATCEALVSGGTATLWAEYGFTGDLDEEWSALGTPQDPSIFLNISDSTALGSFRFILSLINDAAGTGLTQGAIVGCGAVFACAGDGIAAMQASGSVLGTYEIRNPTNGTNQSFPYEVSSDTDFRIHVVPEPGTLALLGMGLLGLGASLRRKAA